MSKTCKVDWLDLDGTSPKPKRLNLEKDEADSVYHCPIQECDCDGFQSQRGCRNVNDVIDVNDVIAKHTWFFYFDGKPKEIDLRWRTQFKIKQVKPQSMLLSYFPCFHHLMISTKCSRNG